MVPRVVFGNGCFDQLGDILLPKRKNSEAPIIYLVDDVFENTSLVSRIPLIFNDRIVFISADEEPKTQQVDTLVAMIKSMNSRNCLRELLGLAEVPSLIFQRQ